MKKTAGGVKELDAGFRATWSDIECAPVVLNSDEAATNDASSMQVKATSNLFVHSGAFKKDEEEELAPAS